jgi:ABC-type phosphate transport system substrate-binding protein
LSETGSSLMAPLFTQWGPAYHTQFPQVYPIINYEYAIVSISQPSATRARDLRAFLTWAIRTGTVQLAQVNFQPLPPSVVTLPQAQIAKTKG